MTGADRLATRASRPWSWCMALVFAMLAFQTGTSAHAQSSNVANISGLQYELTRLRQDLSAMQRQIAAQRNAQPGVAPAVPSSRITPVGNETATAQLQQRFDRMDIDLRGLTGKVEELGFQITQIGGRLDKLVADMDFRLSALERRPAAGADPTDQSATATIEPGAADAPQPDQPQATPQQQYAQAYGLLRTGDYAAAAVGLEGFLAANPTHELAGNAIYWLGETYYVRNDYERAARYFLEGFEKYPKSRKGSDNLLKLGMTLAALGHKADACQTFSEIHKQYPDAKPEIMSKVAQQIKRADCTS